MTSDRPHPINEFRILERNRAFARTMEHLKAAHGHLLLAQTENVNFALNLTALTEIDHQVVHSIHCCAHVYKQPPETSA